MWSTRFLFERFGSERRADFNFTRTHEPGDERGLHLSRSGCLFLT
ncbi:MAG: hypothetical protein QHH43_04400 [Candidatus Saccharicenans sp.]|nr:hypothetical protein [Candidatus Saccharicenans sp.]